MIRRVLVLSESHRNRSLRWLRALPKASVAAFAVVVAHHARPPVDRA